jgi:hypothetical protein
MMRQYPKSRRQVLRLASSFAGLALPLVRSARAQAKRKVTVRLDWIYQGPNAGFVVAQASTSRSGPARDPATPLSSSPARRRNLALPTDMSSAMACRRA